MRARLGGRAPPCGLGARLRRLRLASIKRNAGLPPARVSAALRVGACARAGSFFANSPPAGGEFAPRPSQARFPRPPPPSRCCGSARFAGCIAALLHPFARRGRVLVGGKRCGAARGFSCLLSSGGALLSPLPRPRSPIAGGAGAGAPTARAVRAAGGASPPRAFVCARLCVAGSAAYSIPRCVAGLLLPAGGLLGVPRGGQAPAGRASGGLSPPRDLACARGKRNAAEVRLFCLALAEALPPFPVSPKGESAAQKRMRALCRFGSLIVRFFAAGVFALFFPLYSALSRVSLAAALQPLTAAVLRGRAERKN